jgi:D-alanyl-D-alanine carboxypeptidase (penicillin-binding protein 5/6)
LKAGEQISVREAILALIVKSANDAAIVVAENVAGSEQKFAKLMNIRAKQLGMKNSFFTKIQICIFFSD